MRSMFGFLKTQSRKNYALYDAILRNSLRDVISAIESGADVNAKTPDNEPFLSVAFKHKNIDVFTELLNSKADPNLKFGLRSPIILSIDSRKYDFIRTLLDHGCDINGVIDDAYQIRIIDYAKDLHNGSYQFINSYFEESSLNKVIESQNSEAEQLHF